MQNSKAPCDTLNMDTKLGERHTEFKNLVREEMESLRAEASVAARVEAQGAEEGDADTEKPQNSAAFKAFLENVQARIGEITKPELLETIRFYEEKARNLVNSNVHLAVFPGSETELMKLMEGAAAVQYRGSGSNWVGIVIDPAQWGEAVTNPNIRVCPLNLPYLKSFLGAVLATRDKQQLNLHSRDVYLYYDSGMAGNSSKVLASFQSGSGEALAKQTFTVYLSYDEESLRQRRQYVKSSTTMFNQVEQLHLVTAEALGDTMPHTNRVIYKGTNHGNKIGDIMLDSPTALWSMKLQDIHLFGPFFAKLLTYFFRPGKPPAPAEGGPDCPPAAGVESWRRWEAAVRCLLWLYYY